MNVCSTYISVIVGYAFWLSFYYSSCQLYIHITLMIKLSSITFGMLSVVQCFPWQPETILWMFNTFYMKMHWDAPYFIRGWLIITVKYSGLSCKKLLYPNILYFHVLCSPYSTAVSHTVTLFSTAALICVFYRGFVWYNVLWVNSKQHLNSITSLSIIQAVLIASISVLLLLCNKNNCVNTYV